MTRELVRRQPRVAEFKGMSKKMFYLHLKACGFRHDRSNQNVYLMILEIVRLKLTVTVMTL